MGFSFSQPEPAELEAAPPHPPGLSPLRQCRHGEGSWCQYDYLLKVVLVGDYGAGKTSLLMRAVEDRFQTTDLYRSEFRLRLIEYKGLTICFQIWDPGGYFRDAHAILVCFDADRPDNLSTLEPWIRQVSETNLPFDLVSFVGCKLDLHPALLYDPWEDARNILVTIKPSRDAGCAFAVLPDELIYTIALFLMKMDGVTGLPPPYGRAYHGQRRIPRKELEELSAQYQRPVYLTSSKDGIGTDELFLSLAEDIFDKFWITKDGVPLTKTDRLGESRNTADDGKNFREQPYCIRPRVKKLLSDDTSLV